MGMEKTWFVKSYFYFNDFDQHKVEFELFVSFSLFFHLNIWSWTFFISISNHEKANYMKQGFSFGKKVLNFF